jgi:hypothetical protein
VVVFKYGRPTVGRDDVTENDASTGTPAPSERAQNRRRFVVVGLLVAALFVGALIDGTQFKDVETLVNISQGLVTTLGILVAGTWALYTFVLGRSFAANVQIQFEPVHIIELASNKVAVVSVKAKNIGRTRVDVTEVWFSVAAVTDEELNKEPLTQIPTTVGKGRRTYQVFTELLALEPEEEKAEVIAFALGQYSKVKVQVFFSGEVRYVPLRRHDVVDWTARAILDIRMFQGGS